jgi:hypothetical protein
MKFTNPFRKPYMNIIKESLAVNGRNFTILFFTVLFLLFVQRLGNINWLHPLILIVSILALLPLVNSLVLSLTQVSEKSIQIKEGAVRIEYPFFKKNLILPFEDIEITTNYLSIINETTIYVKSKEEFVEVTSVTPKAWRDFAIKNSIPIAVEYYCDEKVKMKSGIISPVFLGDDWYIIQKDLKNDLKLEQDEWQTYLKTNSAIKFQGKGEYINFDTIQYPQPIYYSLETRYGIKSITFIDSHLAAQYERGKEPFELKKIATDLKCDLSNIEGIKTGYNNK